MPAASYFASEMIEAYPDAKVVLNVRGDLDKRHQSTINTLVGGSKSWLFWCMSGFGKGTFWAWHLYERLPLVWSVQVSRW